MQPPASPEPPPAPKATHLPPRTQLLSYEDFRKQQDFQKQPTPIAEEPGTEPITPEPVSENRPFNLHNCWQEFAVHLNKLGKPAESILMKDATPQLDGDVIRIEVAGNHQRDMMDQVRPLLLEHIRQQFQKYLTLEVSIGVYTPAELKPYTDKEKLNAMMQQNPLIREMVERLKLRLR